MTGFTASLLKILTIWPVSFVWRAALDNRIPLRKICVDSACQDIGQGIGQEVCQEEVCQEEGVRCQEEGVRKVSGSCQEVCQKVCHWKFAFLHDQQVTKTANNSTHSSGGGPHSQNGG